jgi:hypothetical protein
MNATRATTALTNDGAVFGTTTETPPEDPDPPPRHEHRDIPKWLVWAVLHVIVHVAIHYGRHEVTKPTNQIPEIYVNNERSYPFR